MNTTIKPKEITQDIDNGANTASFSYYDGIQFAEDNNLKQTTSFSEVSKGTHFMVCCGDVIVKVEEVDYPEIERRLF